MCPSAAGKPVAEDAKAHVAELADAYGSGPYGATRGGSSPLVSTISLSQRWSSALIPPGGQPQLLLWVCESFS